MSLPLTSTAAASSLPAVSTHSHGHGHKKGLSSLTDSTDSTDSSSSTTAQAGSTQDLFSSLLTSMEQVIGTQPTNSSTQTASALKTTSVGQTNSQTNPAASALGSAATSLLGTVGSALKLFA